MIMVFIDIILISPSSRYFSIFHSFLATLPYSLLKQLFPLRICWFLIQPYLLRTQMSSSCHYTNGMIILLSDLTFTKVIPLTSVLGIILSFNLFHNTFLQLTFHFIPICFLSLGNIVLCNDEICLLLPGLYSFTSLLLSNVIFLGIYLSVT